MNRPTGTNPWMASQILGEFSPDSRVPALEDIGTYATILNQFLLAQQPRVHPLHLPVPRVYQLSEKVAQEYTADWQRAYGDRWQLDAWWPQISPPAELRLIPSIHVPLLCFFQQDGKLPHLGSAEMQGTSFSRLLVESLADRATGVALFEVCPAQSSAGSSVAAVLDFDPDQPEGSHLFVGKLLSLERQLDWMCFYMRWQWNHVKDNIVAGILHSQGSSNADPPAFLRSFHTSQHPMAVSVRNAVPKLMELVQLGKFHLLGPVVSVKDGGDGVCADWESSVTDW